MGPNAPRDQQRAPQPDIFWRRRVIALALGIAVIGLLAWAVNGVVGGSSATSQTADGGQTKSPAAIPASVSAVPSIAPSGASASATPTPTPTATPTPTRKTVTTAHTGDGCSAADVVINLTAAGQSYGPGARPTFDVTVVSTAAHTCAFDIGAKGVRVVIDSGPARVWASSDCPASASARVTKLARGVPATLRFSWNRKTSLAGCGPAGAPAGPGTYTATVYSGQLHSNTVVFVLRGKGIAEP
jgi:hypothetical protein